MVDTLKIMEKKDKFFIMKAAEWFFYDLHEQSLRLLTEADEHARHISGVCYNAIWQEETAKKILVNVHNLAEEFYEMYKLGKTIADERKDSAD